MKKIIPIIIIAVAIIASWFILNPGDSFDYVVTVDQEITELETQLAEIEAAIQAGTLTEEEATAAKVQIVQRLETINASVTATNKVKLTQEQKDALADGLLRLKDMLVSYQSTLSSIDDQANDTVVKAQLNRSGGGSSKKLSLEVADVIEAVEEHAEEVINDYVPDEVTDQIIEDIIEEETAIIDSEDNDIETENNESASSTDEASNPEVEIEDDSTQAENTGGTTTENESAEDTNDSSITIETEGDIEINQ